ncbi:MAG: serine hydroxymethyltransferase [Erysipelotrichaceae bacterium]|jgi:glycine hydroxymethyltransferase|nr:serine hydroxymethyltransferase [Erysipelotrichaceae bacterium]
MSDREIFELIDEEARRQTNNIELIASENYTSQEVLKAAGSILTNKYAEGYPGRRHYGGCEVIDKIETLAIERCKSLFGAEHANVQPHSGSSANMAVYMSILEPGDKVLGMDLNAGGHLTHGSPVNFSGKIYQFFSYGVNRETETIDYDEVYQIAQEVKPKLIVAGASAYPRIIDFAKFEEIAKSVGAKLMVDMAHIAGLVATGHHPSPVPYSDFVTSTTHKTLRGPRSGLVLCKSEYARSLDRCVFPGIQGGPLEHIIASKAICFKKAAASDFKDYSSQIIANTQAFVKSLQAQGLRIVSGGSDNHLILADVLSSYNLTGKQAEAALDAVAITANKNTIPFDTQKALVTSGIRLGTPAMTTRGFKEKEFTQVGTWIGEVLKHFGDESVYQRVRKEVLALTANYPLDWEKP